MAAGVRDLGLDKLPVADKVALINELWTEVVAEERSNPIPVELANKLDQRTAEYEANQDKLHSIEEVMLALKADRES